MMAFARLFSNLCIIAVFWFVIFEWSGIILRVFFSKFINLEVGRTKKCHTTWHHLQKKLTAYVDLNVTFMH